MGLTETRPPTELQASHGSDRKLVDRCLAGDRRGWEELVRRYERLLYGIALRCGLSAEDAADVFQTVCVRLFENLQKLRDDTHLRAWLITTAKHEAWRVCRREGRFAPIPRPDGAAESEAPVLAASDPLPEEILIALEEEHLVRMALCELGERCRRLLELLYQTDPTASYGEVSLEMNIPVGSIGPTRSRCLQSLRKVLVRLDF